LPMPSQGMTAIRYVFFALVIERFLEAFRLDRAR
jgi:hypothetical protein